MSKSKLIAADKVPEPMDDAAVMSDTAAYVKFLDAQAMVKKKQKWARDRQADSPHLKVPQMKAQFYVAIAAMTISGSPRRLRYGAS